MNDISPRNHTTLDATQVILLVGLCVKATIFRFPWSPITIDDRFSDGLPDLSRVSLHLREMV